MSHTHSHIHTQRQKMNELADMTVPRQLTEKQKNLRFFRDTFSLDLIAQITVQGYQRKEENKVEYPPTSKKKFKRLVNVSNFVKTVFYCNCYETSQGI